MTDFEKECKLTNENWDEITHKTYHLVFLNERNAIRAVLYDLLQLDNDINCTNVEIQALKTNFESQLCYLESEIKALQENEYLELDDKNQLIAEQVKKIEKTNLAFATEVEKYHLIRTNRYHATNENVDKLFQLKSQFRGTHETQVESLRRFKMFCHRDTRQAVEIRLKSVDKKFCDEMFYINSCEKGLKHIFSLIDDKSSHGGICSTVSSTTEASKICSEFFTDFAWMRNEQLTKRTELFDYFRKYLAKDLISAMAAMHVYKPDEPIKFIANFLKHLQQNEYRVTKQERIFAAAKQGEHLFPPRNA